MKRTKLLFTILCTVSFIFVSIYLVNNLTAETIIENLPLKRKLRPQNNKPHSFDETETIGNWEMLWEQPILFIGSSLDWNRIAAIQNTFCYTGYQDTSILRRVELICLDIHDGKTKWLGDAAAHVEVVNDHMQIYVSGQPGIIAYGAKTGGKTWQRTVQERYIGDLIAHSGFVTVKGPVDAFYIFDADDGKIQFDGSVPVVTPNSFGSDGATRFDLAINRRLEAWNTQNNTLIWDWELSDNVHVHPEFHDGIVFARSGRQLGTIYAINNETGGILWSQKENVVSNFAVSNGTVFFITTEGEIVSVDAWTGNQKGKLQLDSKLPISLYNSNYSHYSIKAINDIVLVFLGDTGQLFSIRYSPE